MSVPHACTIGMNCTFMGRATPTLGVMGNVNLETDRIIIGDYCVFGHNVRIINPVTIANGTQIKAHSVVMASVIREGSIISGFPARHVAEVPLATVMAWSPINRTFIA
jgi:UDP-3-O-[3-hydroxymyristoyl] glucosamine N-acyltransferase